MTAGNCTRCGGGGWLCEDHPDQPSPHEGCGAMGVPCPDCNADDPPRPPDGWLSFHMPRSSDTMDP